MRSNVDTRIGCIRFGSSIFFVYNDESAVFRVGGFEESSERSGFDSLDISIGHFYQFIIFGHLFQCTVRTSIIYNNHLEKRIFQCKHGVHIINDCLFFIEGRSNYRNARCIGGFLDCFPHIAFHIVILSPFQRNEREEGECDEEYRQHARIKEYEIIEECKYYISHIL